MKVVLCAEGTAPLVQHNERLADPLDEITREIGKTSKKRNKSEADHLELARLEFLGGLYTEPQLSLSMNGDAPPPGIPAWNVLRCLQEGAKRQKRGADVLRGVRPIEQHVLLDYEGPENPHDLWVDGRFSLRKTVGVQRSRTVRTRPIFVDWKLELPVEVDAKVFDLDVLANCWRDAGTYAGLGEMRPVYGTFNATIEESA